MKDTLEELKKVNTILDKYEHPILEENKKLKIKIKKARRKLCQQLKNRPTT